MINYMQLSISMINELIYRLCNTFSGPGNETAISTTIKKETSLYINNSYINKNNNVICQIGNPNSNRHILIDAHIDQISMVVTEIDKNGFINIAPCGGVDCRVLPGTTVYIHGKSMITGIVCSTPPHLSSKENNTFVKVESLIVDTGLSENKVNDLISIGDYISFTTKPQNLLGNKITAQALDNRAGVAALIRCMQMLKDQSLDCYVTFLFSTQEEIGSLGAKTTTFSLDPTESITVDVSFGNQPQVANEKCGILSKGPMIGIAPSLSRNMSNLLIKLAKENDIPYQIEIMSSSTGTTSDVITSSKCGIEGGILSIPMRYMHTPVEVIDTTDIEFTAKLLSLYVLNGGINND